MPASQTVAPAAIGETPVGRPVNGGLAHGERRLTIPLKHMGRDPYACPT